MQAIYDDLVRNTQKILSSWSGDATRRQSRMQAPLESGETHDDDPETLAEEGADSEEEGEPEEQAPLRPPDKYGLDIDGEFRGKVKGNSWAGKRSQKWPSK